MQLLGQFKNATFCMLKKCNAHKINCLAQKNFRKSFLKFTQKTHFRKSGFLQKKSPLIFSNLQNRILAIFENDRAFRKAKSHFRKNLTRFWQAKNGLFYYLVDFQQNRKNRIFENDFRMSKSAFENVYRIHNQCDNTNLMGFWTTNQVIKKI